jgi:murein DD-endopeptidase MepM/ murein hydrolase activator NlpD
MFDILIFFLGFVCIAILGVWAGSKIYMEYEHYHLTKQMDKLEMQRTQYAEQLQKMIQRERHMRLIVGLPDIHSDIRQVGIGGNNYASLMEPANISGERYFPVILNNQNASDTQTIQLQQMLNKMVRKARLSVASHVELQRHAIENQNNLDHLPTIRPVSGVTSSHFGIRTDPFTGKKRIHQGIDIAAPAGSLVWSTAEGVVLRTGVGIRYGRFIDIDHKNGMITRYGHLSSILVTRGMEVARGETIGKIGNTGRASGYHLHYEVHRHGQRIDPQMFFWPEKLVVN